EVLPLVPVMWIEGYARCGSPSTSISAEIRATDGSSLVSPQRVASSASTSRSAWSTSGSAGRAGTPASGGPPCVRRVRLPASITARSGSRLVSASMISSKESRGSGSSASLFGGRSLTGASLRKGGRRTRPRLPRAGRARPPSRGGADGPGATRRRSALGQLGELVVDADDVLLRLGEAGADLVHDVVGRLGEERLVAQLRLRLLALLLRGGEVLGEPLALGGDVDRAGQVQRDLGAADRQGRRGGEGVPLRLEPEQLADGRLVAGQRGAVEGQPGRDPLAGLQALVGPEAADLGDHRLERG